MLAAIDYDLQEDREAEEAAIAYALHHEDGPRRLLALVKPEDLYTLEAKAAYERMVELEKANEPINLFTMARSGAVSPTWMHDIIRGNVVTGSVTLEFWAEFIQRQGRARFDRRPVRFDIDKPRLIPQRIPDQVADPAPGEHILPRVDFGDR